MTTQNFVTLPREVVEWAKDTTTISQLYKLLNAALTEQVQPAQGERPKPIKNPNEDWEHGWNAALAASLQSNAERVPMTGEAWLTKGQQ